MSDPTTETDLGGELIVEMEVDIAAPPDAVFDHLVDPAKVMRWMALDGDLDVRPGGRFHFRLTSDDIARGEYVEIIRPTRLVLTWGWDGSDEVPPGSSTVRFDLTATGDGTRVRLSHTGLPAGARDDHGAGWRYFTARLATAVVGGDPGPIDLSEANADQTGDPP